VLTDSVEYFLLKCSFLNGFFGVFNHLPNSTNFFISFIGAKISDELALFVASFNLLSLCFLSAFTTSFKKNVFHSFSKDLLPFLIEETVLLCDSIRLSASLTPIHSTS
jgi:hypothetical protein